MSGGGGGKMVDRVVDAGSDLVSSVRDDPFGALLYAVPGASNFAGALDLGTRVRDDQREQATGMANKEIARADAEMSSARKDAENRAAKVIDPLTLERRRRASISTGGRSGSILTAGTSLGADDVARKTLLGL
jgi:hypothetical protein